AYASERTLASTATTFAGPQHPTFRLDLGGRDDLVLTEPGHAGGLLGALVFPRPGWYLVQRADAIVAEITTDASGRRLALEEGRYKVTRRENDHLLEADFNVSTREPTPVDPSRMKRIDYARVVRKGGTERSHAWSVFATSGARGEFLDLGLAWRT